MSRILFVFVVYLVFIFVSSVDVENKHHMRLAVKVAGSVSRYLQEMTCVVRGPTVLASLLGGACLSTA